MSATPTPAEEREPSRSSEPSSPTRSAFPPVTWRSLLTGDGLPPSDRALVLRCRERALTRGAVGAAVAGGVVGGLVYRKALFTPPLRFALTLVTTVWGFAMAAMTTSPECLHSIARSRDPQSVLRVELSRIVVMHNPNRALEAIERDHEARDALSAQQRGN